MSFSARQRILVAWLPAIAYTLLIWWLSSQAFELAFMQRVPLQDKGVHFIEYGALSFFIAHAVTATWPGRETATFFTAVVSTVLLGLLDEMHQSFVPGRFSDVMDLVADTIGAVVAAFLYMALTFGYRALIRGRERTSSVR
jgi:VanZ family protein